MLRVKLGLAVHNTYALLEEAFGFLKIEQASAPMEDATQ